LKKGKGAAQAAAARHEGKKAGHAAGERSAGADEEKKAARAAGEKWEAAAPEKTLTPAPEKAEAVRRRDRLSAVFRRRIFHVYKGIARFAKTRYHPMIQQLLDYAGVSTEADIWLGSRLLVAFLFSFLAFILPWTVFHYLGWIQIETLADYLRAVALSSLLGVLTFLFVLLLYYLHIYYVIDDRTKRVERVLPDFLLMVAANMRAGMTPFTAFHTSARPEFGPLEEVIRLVAAKTLGTESLATAFEEIPKYVKSSLLKKTVSFFEKGMKSGGHLALLLESSAEEMRETQELKHELIVSTRTYSVFLLFVVIIGIPLLFAISSQFLSTFSKIQEQQASAQFGGESGISFFSGELTLKPQFVIQASYVLLVITSFLVSILIGVIGEGKLLYGVKYFLPVCVGSLMTFFVIREAIASVMGAIGGL